MINKTTILLSILLIASIFTGCFEKLPAINSKIFEETYPVESGMGLEVYNFNGSVTITTWSNNTVKIWAEKKTNFRKTELGNVKINVEKGTNLVVKSEKLAINPKVSITYDIKILNFMTLTDIETSNGGIKIEGCKGNVFLRSSNRGIDVFDYEGDINGITSNGGIAAQKINGNARLATSNGGINVKDIQGSVKLDSGGDLLTITTSNANIYLMRMD